MQPEGRPRLAGNRALILGLKIRLAGLGDAEKDILFLGGESFDRVDQIGNQIEPSLQLVLDLSPCTANILVQGDGLVVSGHHTTTEHHTADDEDRQHDK